MASYDGHASKRQRTEDGYGVQAGKRDSFEDPHKPSPSPVVHVRGLSDSVAEPDLMSSLQNFGHISFVMILHSRRQALVEFDDINNAMNLVQYAETAPVYVGGRIAHFNYSTSQKISRPPGSHEENPNKVLLLTIFNPKYPITVDVMHTICSNNGPVARIVIFRKNGLQCMVEFETLEGAQRAKQALNGADIYSGCCTLKIEYAKPTRLNVSRNDSEMWDYTAPAGPKNEFNSKSAPLLAEPRYGSAPMPFGSGDSPRSRGPALQPPPPQSSMDYGQADHYDNYGRNDRYQEQFSPPSRHDPYGPPMRGHDPYGPPPGNFSDGGSQSGGPPGLYQQGSVLMVYGLDGDKMNCQRVFNLFCLYGNVVRIKFLKSKEGTAMVQLGDPASCERAIKNLSNCFFFGKKLQLAFSKQVYLQDVHNPHELIDGSPSFVDFMGSRNNRFTNPDASSKNRINPPYKCLHYFNAPANLNEEQINQLFIDNDAKAPAKIKIFPSKSEKSSTGLLEWDSKSDAVEALIHCNHTPVDNPNGKNPYIFKMCFSGSPILDRP